MKKAIALLQAFVLLCLPAALAQARAAKIPRE